MKKICIYGDSVMKGIILNETSDRYTVMRPENLKLIEKKYGLEIDNCSQMGNTIVRGEKRIEYDLCHSFDYDTVLVEYGGNDCDFDWEKVAQQPDTEHFPKTDLHVFEEKYIALVDSLKEKGVKPVLMTLPPINSSKYFSWITKDGLSKENILAWLGDVDLIYRHQELYSGIITRVAMQTKSLLVDVRSYFLDRHNYAKYICNDGIHPNEDGHKLIFTAFDDYLGKIM